jgi:hypothetical protein
MTADPGVSFVLVLILPKLCFAVAEVRFGVVPVLESSENRPAAAKEVIPKGRGICSLSAISEVVVGLLNICKVLLPVDWLVRVLPVLVS